MARSPELSGTPERGYLPGRQDACSLQKPSEFVIAGPICPDSRGLVLQGPVRVCEAENPRLSPGLWFWLTDPNRSHEDPPAGLQPLELRVVLSGSPGIRLAMLWINRRTNVRDLPCVATQYPML